MGVITIELTDAQSATVRMARGLHVNRVRLVHYYVRTGGTTEDTVRVDIDWLSGYANVLHASNVSAGGNDHLLVLPIQRTEKESSSLGSGIVFSPSNQVIPAVFHVNCYKDDGTPVTVEKLVLHFVHEDGRPI